MKGAWAIPQGGEGRLRQGQRQRSLGGDPVLEIVRMVEEDYAVMSRWSRRTHLADGAPVRTGKSDAFAMRHAKIADRRVFLVHLTENDDK